MVSTCISVLTSLMAVGGFRFGVWQYCKAEKWKRAEFVMKEIREFESLSGVKKALLMLKWTGRPISLIADKEPIAVTTTMMAEAFCIDQTETITQESVLYEERACYSRCFDGPPDGLQRFESFVQAGLVRKGEIAPYLSHCVELLAKPDQDHDRATFQRNFFAYLVRWRYTGVQSLIHSFGYRLPLEIPARSRLKNNRTLKVGLKNKRLAATCNLFVSVLTPSAVQHQENRSFIESECPQ